MNNHYNGVISSPFYFLLSALRISFLWFSIFWCKYLLVVEYSVWPNTDITLWRLTFFSIKNVAKVFLNLCGDMLWVMLYYLYINDQN